MKKREKIGNILENCGSWIFGALFLIILLLVLLAAGNIDYAYKAEFALPNFIYLLLGLLIWTGVRFLEGYCPRSIKKYWTENSEKLIRIGTVLFFVFLVYIVYNSTFPANICKQCLYKLGL